MINKTKGTKWSCVYRRMQHVTISNNVKGKYSSSSS